MHSDQELVEVLKLQPEVRETESPECSGQLLDAGADQSELAIAASADDSGKSEQ